MNAYLVIDEKNLHLVKVEEERNKGGQLEDFINLGNNESLSL